MKFDCKAASHRNAKGEVEEAWVTWTEARLFTEWVIRAIGYTFFLFSIWVGVFGSIASLLSEKPISAAACLIGGGLLFALAWHIPGLRWRIAGNTRGITFHRDGRILIPMGLSPMPLSRGHLSLPHTQIVSIEVEQLIFPKPDDDGVYTHGVRLLFRRGQIAHIAKNLDADEAHMVTVYLNQALMELREDIANANMPVAWSAPQGTATAQSMTYVIN